MAATFKPLPSNCSRAAITQLRTFLLSVPHRCLSSALSTGPSIPPLMVKLATAREARLYGPALAVRRWEYINAGLYAFAALLLSAGLAVLSVGGDDRAGLAVVAVALAFVAAVNLHDLWAHLAGVDWRVGLARYDVQLGLVELLVPAVHAVGCALGVAGLVLLLKKEHEAADMVVLAAVLLWMVGSVLNACQVYERADGRAQLLQAAVQMPQLLGSLLFLLAAIANRSRSPAVLVSRSWVWLSFVGSLLWLVAALFNVLKVFMMHQSDALRLEKLRGGAQERLSRDREGRVPLNWDEHARRRALLPTELR